MGNQFNNDATKKALHCDKCTWVMNDEKGPVADALLTDFMKSVVPQLNELLAGGQKMLMQNGVRDGSSCNHIGNLLTIKKLQFDSKDEFDKSNQQLWCKKDDSKTGQPLGYIRGNSSFAFMVVTGTGHLVPSFEPETTLDMVSNYVAGTWPPKSYCNFNNTSETNNAISNIRKI